MAEGISLSSPMEDATAIPSVNDVLLGKGNLINAHPGNRQFRSLVDLQTERYANTSTKKGKRAIAVEVYAEMQKLDPPVRFLIEGLIHPTTNTTSSATDATPQENEEISKTSTLHVNPNLLRKTWLCVEPEKAMKKILHRLRERIRDEDEPTAAVSPTHSQYNEVDDVFSNDCAIIEDDSREPFKIYPLHTSDVNSEVALLQVQDTSPEDWQLLHHHLRDLSKEESVKRIETEQERRSSDYCGSLDASEYVEGNGLDLVVEPTPGLELESSHHCCNYTLRQWVMSSKPEINPNATDSMQSSTDAAKYIRSALQIALKLTECLLEAEKDEQSDLVNPIPLASIAPENVLIRTKVESAIEQSSEHIMEIIEFAWVMSFLGDDSATGGVMARLFALGKVFYELFSTNELVIDADTTTMLTMMSMHSIDLRNVRNIADKHPQKKSHWRSDQADNTTITNAVSNLVANGIPRPLCSLVKNLLECRHGSFCEDDAYASFADLQQDLQLMMDNPVCFLSNLHINNSPKLEVYDTCYGRDDELMKLSELYERHFTDKNINGVIISGGPGVGKSKLAMSVQKLTNQHGGYFVTTKFEQNQNDIKPLSTISKLFDSLCEMLFNDSSSSELELIEEELKDAIGSQSILQVILPSLNKLMPSSSSLELLATNFVNSALSMAYQLGEFMRVVSAHSKPITMFIDDLQFADTASLRLVGNLLSNERRAIFFIFAHRKDDDILNESFHAWLGSIALFSLEEIHLESMSSDAVNTLISETLHLSPRITRPLSSVLHHKTLGNPLFLRQVLTSLTDQRYIYIDMAQHRWVWDLDKIMEMEISDGVVMFLIKQIQRLPRDQQFGLQVAACIGTCIIESVVDYLSRDLGHNLKEVLRMVCQEGFMLDVAGTFRFAHDRIQEAVYEMMPEQQRRENHMQFGLSLCTHVLTSSFDNLELFFVAVNQINQGGPAAVHDSSQNSIIAELNLKAGRRAIQFSDCATAFILFQHGISFLGYDKWTSNYQICLDLYDEVTGVACILGQLDVVRLNSEEVIRHARNFDDKLHCICCATKAQGAHNPSESMENANRILLQCQEVLPLSMLENNNLRSKIDQMVYILRSMSDDAIYNMKESNDKKTNTLLNLYANLSHFMQHFKPWLIGSLSLRMVEITMNTGLGSKASIAFAYFGGVLISIGYVSEGRRLGKLALNLVEKIGSTYKPIVICIVYDTVFWAFEPFQLIVESHMLGYKGGQQAGDIVVAHKNLLLAITTNFFAGQRLDDVRKSVRDFILKIGDKRIFFGNSVLLLAHVKSLQEGPDAVIEDGNLPSETEILADPISGPSVLLFGKVHNLTRAFLFRQMFDATLHIGISEAVAEECHLLKTYFVMGYFFEGLASFQLARLNKSATAWVDRGRKVLERLRCWSGHSSWNWENKYMLLEAENKYTEGDFASAESLYDSAIQSAHAHAFIHEEAIACELAGAFYHERGFHQESYPYFMHSIKSYNEWGAFAVARRVETFVRGKFRTEGNDQADTAVTSSSLDHLFVFSQCSKKRFGFGE